MKIPIYPNQRSFNFSLVDFRGLIEWMRSKWKDDIELLRSIKKQEGKKEYSVQKQQRLQAIMPSVVLIDGQSKKEENIQEYTQIICLDFDGLSSKELDTLHAKLWQDPHTNAFFVSPSGEGVKVFVRVTTPLEDHRMAYATLGLYFHHFYDLNLTLDAKCKNPNRICYVSYDPTAFYTDNFQPFDPYRYLVSHCRTYADKREPYTENNRNQHIFLTAINCRNIGLPVESIIPTFQDLFSDYQDTERPGQLEDTIRSAYSRADKLGNLQEWLTPRKGKRPWVMPTVRLGESKVPADTGKDAGAVHTGSDTGTPEKKGSVPARPKPEGAGGASTGKKAGSGSEKKKAATSKNPGDKAKQAEPEGSGGFGVAKVINNAYYTPDHTPLSNFVIKPLYQVNSEDSESFVIAKLKNIHGHEKTVDMELTDFISPARFRLKGLTAGFFTLYATADKKLPYIQGAVFKEIPTSEKIITLGWQRQHGFYAFSNGIIRDQGFDPVDEYGMVKVKDQAFYLPAFSKINEHRFLSFENARKFCYIEHEGTTPKYWMELVQRAFGNNGVMGICFYLTALFRDVITDHVRFPILMLCGEPETGKSTMAESFMKMFGKGQQEINLGSKSSQKGMVRTFAQIANALIWVDEFKNYLPDEVHDQLKAIYDSGGYRIAQYNAGYDTMDIPILSSCMLSGEELPTKNSALFTRVLLCLFRGKAFTEDQKKAYEELRDREQEGLTTITGTLLGYRDLIKERFRHTYYDIYENLQKLTQSKGESIKITDRALKNVAVVLAPYLILKLHAKELNLPLDWGELLSLSVAHIYRQSKMVQENTDLSRFWDIFEQLAEDNKIKEGSDYVLNKWGFCVRLSRVYNLYSKEYMQMYRREAPPKASIINFMQGHDAFKDKSEVGKNPRSVKFPDFGSTTGYIFDFHRLGITLKGELKVEPITHDTADDDSEPDSPSPF